MVPFDNLVEMERIIGFTLEKPPFCYLCLPIGTNMTQMQTWQGIVHHFKKKLSTWKMIMFSVGGLYMLTSSVLSSLSIYFRSLFLMLVQMKTTL